MNKHNTILFLVIALVMAYGCSESHQAQTKNVSASSPKQEVFNQPSDIVPTNGFLARQALYLQDSLASAGLDAQAAHVAMNIPVNEAVVDQALAKINSRKDCSDFPLNTLMRMLYLDRETSGLSPELRAKIKETVLNFKYWFDEPGDDSMIMWTENHQILFHTAELLAGQLYRDEVFPNSGLTGAEHVAHALPYLRAWLNNRGRFGFVEWHSNIYYNEDLPALVNLVDFAEDEAVATKAAMLVDLMAFDFANNYYQGTYATTHGRTEDDKKVGEGWDKLPSRDSTSEAAWILLGIGEHSTQASSNFGAVALATSKRYVPPAILEGIAAEVVTSHEHKERSSINVFDGSNYGLGYESLTDLMFWWGISAPAASPVIETSMQTMETYGLDPALIFNDAVLVDFLNLAAQLRGLSLSEYSNKIKDVTEGVCLETVSTYTYRTPSYQLSGAQDHQKGMAGLQEHIWQASLDPYAVVFTSSPGGLSPQEFTGGWKPRAALYKNVGIIQYDRDLQLFEVELVFLLLGVKPYTHAYFPQWAFDEVKSCGWWTFGTRGDGYVALYSFIPPCWESEYELRAFGKKNVWIVELGSSDKYGSFEGFVCAMKKAKVCIVPQCQGFCVRYESPSLGTVQVAWDGPLKVAGQEIDLGPYPRYDNSYCFQDFGTNKTVISRGSQRLELDFATAARAYFE